MLLWRVLSSITGGMDVYNGQVTCGYLLHWTVNIVAPVMVHVSQSHRGADAISCRCTWGNRAWATVYKRSCCCCQTQRCLGIKQETRPSAHIEMGHHLQAPSWHSMVSISTPGGHKVAGQQIQCCLGSQLYVPSRAGGTPKLRLPALLLSGFLQEQLPLNLSTPCASILPVCSCRGPGLTRCA